MLSYAFSWRFGVVDNDVGMGEHIGVLLPVPEISLALSKHPGQLSLAIPPWIGAMSTGQRAMIIRCGSGVKAGMARV